MNPDFWKDWLQREREIEEAARAKREQAHREWLMDALLNDAADAWVPKVDPATECCPVCSGKGRVRIVPEAL